MGIMRFFQSVFTIVLMSITLSGLGQNAVLTQGDSLKSYPVLFKGDTILHLQYGMGDMSGVERATITQTRLSEILTFEGFSSDSFTVKPSNAGFVIGYLTKPLLTITDEDAKNQNVTAEALAITIKNRFKTSSEKKETWKTVKRILLGLLWSAITIGVLVFLIKLINRLFPRLYLKIRGIKESKIKSIKIQNIEIISATRIYIIILWAAQALRWFVFGVLFYFFIPAILGYFPETQHLAGKLIGYVITPLKSVFLSFFGFLPNLFYIAVICAISFYIIKGIRFIFNEIGKGNLTLPGFYEDWATPTFNIVRVVVIIFTAIVIFPYLPGSDSPVFRGISVFVGLLISFGSGSAIANAFSGIVLTYMRPFKVGDRVKIADAVGDVREKTLLVTRLRTIKNVDISIPNILVLGSHIINFSSAIGKEGVIAHTTITIGYDVPWRQVHELMISCAADCEFLEKEPKPFVLQTSLDDFYVSYELNATTHSPQKMSVIHSMMHQSIQDKFNEAGVEILSPHYGAHRDGNQMAVPSEYLPPQYSAPSFRLFNQQPAKKSE
jgi:small-conductance mechanosensitive channel